MAQSQPSPTPTIRPKLYVTEFTAGSATKDNLNEFTRQLFQLRFQALSNVDVAPENETPPCGEGSGTLAQASAQSAGRSAKDQQSSTFIPTYYSVQGTLNAHSPTHIEGKSNILLSYELVKSTNCSNSTIFRRTRVFGLLEALQNLEDAADELSVQLDDDIAAKVAVKVETIQEVGDPHGSYRASELMTRFLRQSVADARTLRLWDESSKGRPAYTFTGTVQFSESKKSAVAVRAQFEVNGQALALSLPEEAVPPNPDALITFYLNASSAAVKGLTTLLDTQRAGLSGISSSNLDALIGKAKELLCLSGATEGFGCSADPLAALAALNEAAKLEDNSKRLEITTLTAQAQYKAAQYVAAAETYDKALSIAPPGGDARVDLLRQSGDAWYDAKQYSNAADRYRDCLKLASSDPSVTTSQRLQGRARERLATSLTLANQPEAGLDVLLESLKLTRTWPNAADNPGGYYEMFSRELPDHVNALPESALQSAFAKIESQLTFDPKLEFSALYQISRAFATGGKYKEAITGYRKVLAHEPDNYEVYYNLGSALLADGDSAATIEVLHKAIELNPNDANSYNDLGVALYRQRQYDHAIEAYQKAVEKKGDFALALNNLGGTLETLGRYDEAAEAYRRAINTNRTEPLAYFNLYWIYRLRNNEDAAQKVLRELEYVAPDHAYTQVILASLRQDAGDYLSAAQIFSKVAEQNPWNHTYPLLAAESQIQAGMQKQDPKLIQAGLQQLQQETYKNPSHESYLALGWAYVTVPKIRDPHKAREAFEKALELSPDDALALSDLAAVALAEGDFQRAIQESDKVLKLNPRDPATLENRGYAQFLAGDSNAAISSYKAALDISPNEVGTLACYGETLAWSVPPEAHNELAKARTALGQPGRDDTWLRIILARYEPNGKQKAVYITSIAQKGALIELLDALAYMRQREVEPALERYRAATGMLSTSNEDDKDTVGKGINDLHRLEKESSGDSAAALGLGYLYDWLGEKSEAAQYWQRYLKSGTDPLGMQEARRHAAEKNP